MRLWALVGLACVGVAVTASPAAAGRFTGPLPDEFRSGCWHTPTDLDDVLAQYGRRLANGDVAAARALWQGQSRRHAADVLRFVAGPAPAGNDFGDLRREVEAAVRPAAILKEL